MLLFSGSLLFGVGVGAVVVDMIVCVDGGVVCYAFVDVGWCCWCC